MKRRIWPGRPYPLGATWDGAGVNFAVFSENAGSAELCLFDDAGESRIPFKERTDHIWHLYLPQARPGQLYGFRMHGSYAPSRGHRFNPAKLLLDPYAKAIAGTVRVEDRLFGYRAGHPRDPVPDARDSAPALPKCVVVDDAFSWGNDAPPAVPWSRTVIYELHVKGFTKLHPQVAPELRGTYSGLASPEAVDYLRSLGITAVELMPVHQGLSEQRLVKSGLSNYWGYNTVGYFAPDARFASAGTAGEQVREFKTMVKTLHREGIEVILDVVYNHSGEGDQGGPTVTFRGLDNAAYYRLLEGDLASYRDYSGCGNTFDMTHPQVLQLIMDSLRYWVGEMHVDGFRFDLASTLARELHDVDRLAAFFDIIHQDPMLSRVKLIAEPWDLGEGGYQVGNFPFLWAEWNAEYRDTVRRFFRGDAGQIGDLAYRLTGSSDLYELSGRRPYASINFVTAHDGFTLEDLVSYNHKHNLENGEDNRDGTDDNASWNCGVEGQTDDEAILRLRARQKRNFLATLLFSQGVPMLLAGDERGRTQNGNNNAYCHDNELSWLSWESKPDREDLLAFTRRVIALFHKHPVFRRRYFFEGRKLYGSEVADITWLRPDGEEMGEADWTNSEARCLGMRLAGDAIRAEDDRGRRLVDDTVLVIMNAHREPIDFRLPVHRPDLKWDLVLDTGEATGLPDGDTWKGGDSYPLDAHSLALLRMGSREG